VQVTLSSLNRHAVATRADVGTPKATALANHFHQIFPEVKVDACVAMYTRENEENVLGGFPCPDLVLDAIDNLDTKVLALSQLAASDVELLDLSSCQSP
jgi:tRNA threonylcarbamoyladenosine dehydratase